jgi:enoyl-CoA hydratase
MPETVRCEVDAAGIARITLDEPNSRANTLHRAVWEQIGNACRSLHDRTDVLGLIIRSAKPGIFVAGADLREIADLPIDDLEPTRALVRRGRDVLAALEALPFPTVALIDGAALGGGFELALACDCRLAGDNPKVKVGLPEVKLGLIPGWGGTQRPSRIVGLAYAVELVCSGELLTAESARNVGLVESVVRSEDLEVSAIERLAHSHRSQGWRETRASKSNSAVRLDGVPAIDALLATLSPELQPACREAHRVATQGAQLPLEDALAIEEAAFVPLVASDNARTQIAKFLKR